MFLTTFSAGKKHPIQSWSLAYFLKEWNPIGFGGIYFLILSYSPEILSGYIVYDGICVLSYRAVRMTELRVYAYCQLHL